MTEASDFMYRYKGEKTIHAMLEAFHKEQLKKIIPSDEENEIKYKILMKMPSKLTAKEQYKVVENVFIIFKNYLKQ